MIGQNFIGHQQNNTFVGVNAGVALTTGSNNVCVGYGSGLTNFPNTDHFTVIVQLHQTKYNHCYLMLFNTDASLFNIKNRVEVTVIQRRCINYYFVDDREYSHGHWISDAIYRYQMMLPKWLHLYQYFVTTNTIDCPDIFHHLFTYYFLTLY